MWSWIDAGGDRLQVGRRTISDRKFTGNVVNGSFSHVKFLHVTFSNSYVYALFARAFCSLFLKTYLSIMSILEHKSAYFWIWGDFCNILHATQTDDVSMSPDDIAMDVTSLHITSLKNHY